MYIQDDYWTGTKCLENRVPWLVPGAIHKLDEILNKADTVWEFGTGGSTLFYAERCKSVEAIETNTGWSKKVWEELYATKLSDLVAYLSCSGQQSIQDIIGVSLLSYNYTVLSVDTEQGINRSEILDKCLCKYLHSLRIIVMDNYAEQSLWPDHWHLTEYVMCSLLGDGWVCETFDDIHWYGKGTRIFTKGK